MKNSCFPEAGRQLRVAFVTILIASAIAACDSSSGSGGQVLTECNEPAGTACYNVTFTGLWNPIDHPTGFPSNAHFSPPVGATHNGNVSLWSPGAFASAGIETMAETGATGALSDEVRVARAAFDAQTLIVGSTVDASASTTLSFTVTSDYPLLSLTSMIAPSPDWFVGVDSIALRANGDWVQRIERDLFAYDAGTDDGVAFTSPNADSDPQDAIERIVVSPFAPPAPALARLVVERVL